MDIGLERAEADAVNRITAAADKTIKEMQDKMMAWLSTHKITISIEEKK